jgi:phosphodiesterase/alkaline phosphatase D-like protein
MEHGLMHRAPGPGPTAVALLVVGMLLALPGRWSAQDRAGAVEWMWSGGVTARAATIKARLRGSAAEVSLLYGRQPGPGDVSSQRAAAAKRPGPGGVVSFELRDLAPDTPYFFAIDTARARSATGEFRTHAEGPMSFAFAMSACAGGHLLSSVSNHRVFAAIESRRPLFFLHMGDLHYSNIGRNEIGAFARAYDRVLTQPRQASLFRRVPILYVWDDHDYGPNDSDRTSPSREASRAAYAEHVPHYPLTTENGRVTTIQQEVTVGRVRFIVTDLRSERDPVGTPDGPDKSLLGERQRAWLDASLTRAAADGSALVFWVNTLPWITREGDPSHGWQPYAWERRWLADRIEALGLTRRLVVLSGDAHMLAIDDGRHSNYSSSARPGSAGFPVFHAAPLDRSPSLKGGPYSHGVSARNHQFGWVDVQDDGRELRVTLSGHDADGAEVRGMRLRLVCRERTCEASPGSE